MPKYLVLYRGAKGMGDTQAEQQALAQAWNGWYGTMGAAVLDGGNPLGDSATLESEGSARAAGMSGLTGYLIIAADDMAAAMAHARGCPALLAGGRVEVYEALSFG